MSSPASAPLPKISNSFSSIIYPDGMSKRQKDNINNVLNIAYKAIISTAFMGVLCRENKNRGVATEYVIMSVDRQLRETGIDPLTFIHAFNVNRKFLKVPERTRLSVWLDCTGIYNTKHKLGLEGNNK